MFFVKQQKLHLNKYLCNNFAGIIEKGSSPKTKKSGLKRET